MATSIKKEFTVHTKNWFNRTLYGSSMVEPALEFNRHLHDTFDVVQDYLYLNMTVVRCHESDLNHLAKFPALKTVQFVDHSISDFNKVLRGLNALQNQYMFQVYEWWTHRAKGEALPNDRFEGGIYPPNDYPTSNKAKHLVRPTRKYECPPAYMPVLNLSLGPKCHRNTHVDYALQTLSETRLITVSAGNLGRAVDKKSSINKYIRNEPHEGILVVGATDETGTKLAEYSSTGLKKEKFRRPCVVASPGKFQGTSFSAPKVANLACVCFDAILQVANVEITVRSDTAAGVPLVGWGILDKLDGDLGLPTRTGLPAIPFIGVYEKELRDAFTTLHKLGIFPVFSIHGPPIRHLILSSAKKMNGYGRHEVGCGYVSTNQLLDRLAELQLGKIFSIFCGDEVPLSKVPAKVWNQRVFDRDELTELAAIANQSRPIWVYDYAEPKFIVNREVGGELASLPFSHGARVAIAGTSCPIDLR